eukprot:364297-Chlamydomonas_euryale.AAC.5
MVDGGLAELVYSIWLGARAGIMRTQRVPQSLPTCVSMKHVDASVRMLRRDAATCVLSTVLHVSPECMCDWRMGLFACREGDDGSVCEAHVRVCCLHLWRLYASDCMPASNTPKQKILMVLRRGRGQAYGLAAGQSSSRVQPGLTLCALVPCQQHIKLHGSPFPPLLLGAVKQLGVTRTLSVPARILCSFPKEAST